MFSLLLEDFLSSGRLRCLSRFQAPFVALVRAAWLFSSVALPFLCSAQSSSAASDLSEELRFAEGLADRAYDDLAQDVCERVEKHPKADADVRAEILLIRGKIYRALATKTRDQDLRRSYLDKAAGVLDSFVSSYPKHSRAPDATFEYGDLLREKGSSALDQLRAGVPESEQKKIREDGLQALKRARDYFEQLVSRYYPGFQQNDETAERAMVRAWHSLIATCYFQGVLHVKDESGRKEPLEYAIKQFEDLALEFETYPLFYDASIYVGMIWTELGNLDYAKRWFQAATGLRHLELSERTKTLVLKAYYVYAQTFRSIETAEAAKEAVRVVDEMLSVFGNPKAGVRVDLKKEPMVLASKLEKARALKRIDPTASAALLAELAQRKDRWGVQAQMELAKTGGVGGSQSPEIRLNVIEGLMNVGNYPDAIRQCQRLLGQARAEREKFAPVALHKLGLSYAALDRLYEAALAYQTVYREFPGHERAAECCYRATDAYNKMNALVENDFDRSRYDQILDELDKRYGNTPYAKNVPFLKAERLMTQGKYREAAEEYERVPKVAEAYEGSLAKKGYARYKQATEGAKKHPPETVRELLEKAEKSLTRYLKYVDEEKTLDPKRLSQRKDLVYAAKSTLANLYMHDSLGRYSDALELLDSIAEQYGQDTSKMSRNLAKKLDLYLRMAGKSPASEGAKRLEGLDKAEQVVATLLDGYADSRVVADAANELAHAFEEEAERIDKANPDSPEKSQPLRLKAASYYHRWLRQSLLEDKPVSAEQANAVAERLLLVGQETAEKEMLSQAARLLQEVASGAVFPGELRQDPWKVAWKEAQCYLHLGQLDEARKLYEKLHETNPEQILLYEQLGQIYLNLAPKEPSYYPKALAVYEDLLRKLQGNKWEKIWWQCKYQYLDIFTTMGEKESVLEKGREFVKQAKVGVEQLELVAPAGKDFDGGQHGFSAKFKKLKERISRLLKTLAE